MRRLRQGRWTGVAILIQVPCSDSQRPLHHHTRERTPNVVEGTLWTLQLFN